MNGSANTLPPNPCRNSRRRTRSYFITGSSTRSNDSLAKAGRKRHVTQGLFQATFGPDVVSNGGKGARVPGRFVAPVGVAKVLAGETVVRNAAGRELFAELHGIRHARGLGTKNDFGGHVDVNRVLELSRVGVDLFLRPIPSESIVGLEHEPVRIEHRMAAGAGGRRGFELEALSGAQLGVGLGQRQ